MQPNVLILVMDSLRADRCWGSQRTCVTPVLDDLRGQSSVFTHAFSVASMTSICVSSILTGAYPFVHGVRSLVAPLRPDIPTMAEVFQTHGYHTWAETTGPLENKRGTERGFDTYRHRPYTEWVDTAFGEYLIGKLQKDSAQPWFGYVHLWETHHPRRVPPPFNDPAYGATEYDRAVSAFDAQLQRILEALPENTLLVFTADHGEYVPPAATTSGQVVSKMKTRIEWVKRVFPRTENIRRRVLAATIKAMARSKRRDSEFYRAWVGHGFHVYDSLVHVPLIVRGPGVPQGVEIANLASHVDLFPTLAALCGLAQADTALVSGMSLVPLLQGDQVDADDRAIYLESSGERWNPNPDQWLVGVRTTQYKYARGLSNPKLPEELYDLQQDPAEQHNLIATMPHVAATMRVRLEQLMQAEPNVSTDAETSYSAEELVQIHQHLRELGYND